MGSKVRVCNVGMGGVFVCGNKGGNHVCASKQDLFNSRKY